MGETRQVVARAARRVLYSSAGEVVGRAVNLLLPFALLSVHQASGATDVFFLAFAVSFFFHGSLANALVVALVPELVRDAGRRSMRPLLPWIAFAALGAVVVGTGLLDGESVGRMLWFAVAVATMSVAGLLAAPASAALNADHRYGLPGLTWSIRLLPIGAYLLASPPSGALPLLMAGLALADCCRAAILLASVRGRIGWARDDSGLHFPASALHLLLASAIAGLTPLAARWIVSLGAPGEVSLFEAADRIYSALASLATIGVGSVTVVYLARLPQSSEGRKGWHLLLWTSAAWSLVWLIIALALWWFFPALAAAFDLHADAGIEDVRRIFVFLAAGLPGFVMTGILSRRLLTSGRWRWLVPLALAGALCSVLAAGMLSEYFGPAGVGLGLSVGHYLVLLLMVLILSRASADAIADPV